MSVQEIKESAMKLPPEEREWLAEELLASLDSEEQFSPEFKAMLDRRYEELVSGKVQGISHEEVMRQIKGAIENVHAEVQSSSSR